MPVTSPGTVVITGGGGGIGAACARRLAAVGWRVAVCDLDGAAAQAVATEVGGIGLALDIADAAAVERAAERIEAESGPCTGLVACAARLENPHPPDAQDPAEWQRVIDVNLTGVFLCIQQAFRIMKSQDPKGGRIINNGSISAQVPRPNSAPYTATKHAVTGLTRSASLDGRKHDIAVGQIDIGNAATDMTQRMTQGVPQADGSMAPEPRMDVAHVASAVVYMASLPLDANVQFMTVMATKMPYIGRG